MEPSFQTLLFRIGPLIAPSIIVTISLGGMAAVNAKGEAINCLNTRIADVYQKWKSETGLHIGRSTFYKLKPKTVIGKSKYSKKRMHMPVLW